MQVVAGDTVEMRDGRVVYVTDAASQNPRAYVLTGEQEVPVETIFIGVTATGRTVVSDMSEVVSVL